MLIQQKSLSFPASASISIARSPSSRSSVQVPSANEWAYFASKGIKIVRLPFKWERMQNISGPLSPTYLALAKTQLEMATYNSMTVILDCHNFGSGFGSKLNDPAGNVTYVSNLCRSLDKAGCGIAWKSCNRRIRHYERAQQHAVTDSVARYCTGSHYRHPCCGQSDRHLRRGRSLVGCTELERPEPLAPHAHRLDLHEQGIRWQSMHRVVSALLPRPRQQRDSLQRKDVFLCVGPISRVRVAC